MSLSLVKQPVPGNPYGADIPSPLPRPSSVGRVVNRTPMPPRGTVEGVFPWERRIPINTRDIRRELTLFVNAEEPQISRWLYSTWNAEAKAIKYQEIRNAVRDLDLSPKWIEQWRQDYANLVNDILDPRWREGMQTGGDSIAARIADRLEISWRFPEMTAFMNQWIDTRGAALVKDLTTVQTLALRNVIRHQVVDLGVGPRALDKYIRPLVGLTEQEAGWVLGRRAAWSAQGVTGARLEHMTQNYSGFLQRRRAARIARTELSMAFNFGTFDAVREAQATGVLPSKITKTWSTAGDKKVCPFCRDLEGQAVTLAQTFPGYTAEIPNTLVPPAHPSCRCVVEFNIIGSLPVRTPPIPPMPIPVEGRV